MTQPAAASGLSHSSPGLAALRQAQGEHFDVRLPKGGEPAEPHFIFMYYDLVQCDDGSFYTGVTSNIKRRFTEHKTKSGGWHTKIHKAIKVLYTETYPTKDKALKREKQIKGWRREKKLTLRQTQG